MSGRIALRQRELAMRTSCFLCIVLGLVGCGPDVSPTAEEPYILDPLIGSGLFNPPICGYATYEHLPRFEDLDEEQQSRWPEGVIPLWDPHSIGFEPQQDYVCDGSQAAEADLLLISDFRERWECPEPEPVLLERGCYVPPGGVEEAPELCTFRAFILSDCHAQYCEVYSSDVCGFGRPGGSDD